MPPLYSRHSADHVTLVYKPSEFLSAQLPLGQTISIAVVGVASDGGVQVCLLLCLWQ